jgi:hypothetical protein
MLLANVGCRTAAGTISDPMEPEQFMYGNFTDDYGIQYEINTKTWRLLPDMTFHILSWNKKEEYLLARNDKNNPSDAGKYSRIDYMKLTGMTPYEWAFCISAYDASSIQEAEKTEVADRSNPKKGCNGFPFSRMKRK